MGIKLKKKKVVCLDSYEPPFLNSEKLKAILCRYRKLLAFLFGGYLNSINNIAVSQGTKIKRKISQHLKLTNNKMGTPRMVIRGYTFHRSNKASNTLLKSKYGKQVNNACVYNNTHYVTYFVTFLENFFVMKLYSLSVKFFLAEKNGCIYA